ncbi:hypothetical protein PYW08_016743 [Mythimna loreyi]|uniref:Uncharacterized protein n=1 Tax=Mythimna loreyi TaxID=667449 RepID=A0ACC2QYX4_9NEOP|nr:hypothetical protein PYW08_016743 [Mythimna loreyi]
MPRGKTKVTANAAGPAKKPGKITSSSDENKDELNFANIELKVEPSEPPEEQQPSPSKIDLSQFRFEKKQHIKIEYEKDSAEKENTKGLWEPPNWKEFLLNLRNMRSNNDAPVDTMGCHMSGDLKAAPEVYRYQCLISLMLSSQTKDQVTFAAMERLRARGLTIDNVLNMSDDELGKLIYPVGFWKTKVKYIKKTTQTLKDQYNGDIPDSVDKLCKLTGVGPKMAHICMLVAWDKVTGIGVDTHVHRITNRIGWHKKPTSTPEDTRKSLQTWLPFELWSEVNHLLVGFGQTICLPVSPLCHECLNKDICPSSGLGRKSPKKTPVKKEVKNEQSDDEDDVKPPKSRKVTPRKELNDESINSEIKAGKLTVKKETVENKSPRKRKVTPKQGEQVKPEDDMDDFEMKPDQLSVKAAPKKKVTPNKKMEAADGNSQGNLDAKPASKRRVTPNNKKTEDINPHETLNNFEQNPDELFLTAVTKKKVTPNKKTEVKEVNCQDNLDDFEMKTEKLSAKTASRKRVTPSKKTKTYNILQDDLNVKPAPKKKASANKKAKAEQSSQEDTIEDENDSQPNNETKKSVKKKTVLKNSDENQEFQEPNTDTRNTKSRVAANVLLSTDENNTTNDKPKKSPVTRKSARNKVGVETTK